MRTVWPSPPSSTARSTIPASPTPAPPAALAHVAHAQPAFGPPSQPEAPPVQPEAPPPGPPPGSTQATFVSSGADGWDVLLDRVPVCATPCSIWVAPLQFVSLRIHERNPY